MLAIVVPKVPILYTKKYETDTAPSSTDNTASKTYILGFSNSLAFLDGMLRKSGFMLMYLSISIKIVVWTAIFG